MNAKIIKNRILKLFVIIISVIAAALTFAACEEGTGPSVKLELDTTEARTTFVAGESFSTDGLKVFAVVGGERFVATHADYDVVVPDLSRVGEKKVKISFMGASASYTVTVAPVEANSLALGLSSVKTLYSVGESFDKTGLNVTVVLNNGEKHPVTEFDVEETSFTTPGNKEITVTASYNGTPISDTLNVCVLPKPASEYEASQVLGFTNKSGGRDALTLYVTNIEGGGANNVPAHTYGWTVLKRTDGTTVMDELEYTYNPASWASDFVKCVGTPNWDSGPLEITVDRMLFSAASNAWHYKIIGWDELDYISVDASGAKRSYYVGDEFDPSGVVVTVHRMSGATERIDNIGDMGFSGYSGGSEGEETITVSYAGNSATYTVTIVAVAVESIEIDDEHVKTKYLTGEEFTYAGLIVTAVMNNGSRHEVDLSDCAFTGYDLSVPGNQTVTVTYQGKSETYPISVSEPKGVVTSISVDDTHAKKTFIAGVDTFVATGLIVTVYYEDGTDEEVDVNACSFSGYDMSTVGHYTVTVMYGGQSDTYEIDVERRLERIEVDYSNAERREYVVNMQFTSEGIVVTAIYSDGWSETVDSADYGVSQPDMSTIGVKTITITYEGKHAEYMIYAIPDVDWDTRKLDFGSVSGNSLDLFVTDIQGGGNWGNAATTTGWYLLKLADGTYKMFEFSFTFIPERVPQCEFMTEGLDAEYLDDSQGGDLFVTIDGITFRANADYWHRIVMSW